MWFYCRKYKGLLFNFFQVLSEALSNNFRYNNLLHLIDSSLRDLQKGIIGLVVMSSDLEEIFTCIYEGRVPSGWLRGDKIHYNQPSTNVVLQLIPH